MFNMQSQLPAQIRAQQQQLTQIRWQRRQRSRQLRTEWQTPAFCLLAGATMLWLMLRPPLSTDAQQPPTQQPQPTAPKHRKIETNTWWPALLMLFKFGQLLLLFSPSPQPAAAKAEQSKAD
jgi:hypothetical protein